MTFPSAAAALRGWDTRVALCQQVELKIFWGVFPNKGSPQLLLSWVCLQQIGQRPWPLGSVSTAKKAQACTFAQYVYLKSCCSNYLCWVPGCYVTCNSVLPGCSCEIRLSTCKGNQCQQVLPASNIFKMQGAVVNVNTTKIRPHHLQHLCPGT